ncbi:MAG: hypothetical protein CMJ54_09520 [Planctomycetaceae bacterium]|nr:hypothetical protein [Planctomycetaceae bacterium]
MGHAVRGFRVLPPTSAADSDRLRRSGPRPVEWDGPARRPPVPMMRHRRVPSPLNDPQLQTSGEEASPRNALHARVERPDHWPVV